MVVRVKIKVKCRSTGREVTIPVLVNGGAESEILVIVISVNEASELGLWPTQEYEIVEVGLASGKTYGYLVLKPDNFCHWRTNMFHV